MDHLQPGDSVQGFLVTEVKKIEEYRGTGVRLVHTGTGCEVYHVVTDRMIIGGDDSWFAGKSHWQGEFHL